MTIKRTSRISIAAARGLGGICVTSECAQLGLHIRLLLLLRP